MDQQEDTILNIYQKLNKMATRKKPACKDTRKRVTSATIKADLKKRGYKMPHGYDVVKRKRVVKTKKK